MNLLVPSIGNKIYLARRLRQALSAGGGTLLASDRVADAPALDMADRRISLPRFGSKNFWQAVDRVVVEHRIDAILPARDVELAGWAGRAEAGLLHARTLLSSASTLRACLNKAVLYDAAAKAGVYCPAWQEISTEEMAGDLGFPVIVKPVQGSGTRGVLEIATREELALWRADIDVPYLTQTRKLGTEYSVDCFADPGGELIACCVRERVLVRNGQSVVGRVVEDRHLVEQCHKLASVFAFRGVVNFQFIRDRSASWLIDVNPRIPGGIEITESAGFPFIDWTVAALEAT